MDSAGIFTLKFGRKKRFRASTFTLVEQTLENSAWDVEMLFFLSLFNVTSQGPKVSDQSGEKCNKCCNSHRPRKNRSPQRQELR